MMLQAIQQQQYAAALSTLLLHSLPFNYTNTINQLSNEPI